MYIIIRFVASVVLALFVGVLLGATLAAAQSSPGVSIHPTRQSLAPSERSGHFVLTNASNQTRRYEVATKGLLELERHARDVCKSVLYAPRTVTLPPRRSRSVRFLFLKPFGGLGEERCRLYFKALPMDPSDPGKSKTVGVGFTMLLSISVPVVRGEARR